MTSLNPCYTIGNQLVEAYLQHRRASKREARERAVFLLETVGITAAGSRLKQFPHQLSGGLRQRIMIAMGLMCGPSLIIADEPTTALDVTIQAQILAFGRPSARVPMGLILITHDLGWWPGGSPTLCDVLRSGGETGTGVFARPCPHTGASCVASRCRQGGAGQRVGLHPGLVPTPIGVLKGCTFRNRCPKGRPECAVENPHLREIGPNRALRCLDTLAAAA
jgi:peptide/nickel transport system ATP-binding protein